MGRLLPIHEEDLVALEHILPQWAEFLCCREDALPMHRVQFRQVQKIITDVRWNYGPPTEVTIIPAGPEEPPVEGAPPSD